MKHHHSLAHRSLQGMAAGNTNTTEFTNSAAKSVRPRKIGAKQETPLGHPSSRTHPPSLLQLEGCHCSREWPPVLQLILPQQHPVRCCPLHMHALHQTRVWQYNALLAHHTHSHLNRLPSTDSHQNACHQQVLKMSILASGSACTPNTSSSDSDFCRDQHRHGTASAFETLPAATTAC